MMNLASVIVRTRPEQLEQVRSGLLALPGVEVHAVGEQGQLVVTVEDDDQRDISETMARMHDVKGVLSASMVYHEAFDPNDPIDNDSVEEEASR